MTEIVVRFDDDSNGRPTVSGTVEHRGQAVQVRPFTGWLALLELLESAAGLESDTTTTDTDAAGTSSLR